MTASRIIFVVAALTVLLTHQPRAFASHLPIPENCINGIDDNGDTLIDCADIDCVADPACLPPPGPVCGNSITEPPETCDDGNAVNTDACLNTCVAASCGDGFTQAGVEACDDGNAVNTDACLNTCAAASCGDTFVQAGVETCDDANTTAGDGCSASCQTETAGGCPDEDGDGVCDGLDNCPLVDNGNAEATMEGIGNQTDSDGDGLGDACDEFPDDIDTDGDGIPDGQDNCPLVANVGQLDTDADGVGDVCDLSDIDGDGVVDWADNCPLITNPDQDDDDEDGIGDECDTDFGNVTTCSLSPRSGDTPNGPGSSLFLALPLFLLWMRRMYQRRGCSLIR